MYRKLIRVTFISMLAISSRVIEPKPFNTEPKKSRLLVWVNEIQSAKGEIVVQLYAKHEKLFGEKRITLKAKIAHAKTAVIFEGLLPGEYAVFVFHDENQNGYLDHSFFGMPAEPIGFSNGFRPTILTGRPGFSDIGFLMKEDMTLDVNVK